MHQAGEVVAGFHVERLLGSGGMGEVYLVRHPRLPRLDALKLLPPAASADHSYRERFQREADLAAGLDHDNVVPVYDRGEADGQLWIHMKYVAGQDAAAALRAGGPFSTTRALHVVTRVAAALDAAHRHGLLHRDVKPANILLGEPNGPGEPERVFLTDFGIAKGVGDAAGLTPSGHFAASLDYAAPEQIQVQPLDGRADQYALGCVLFALLAGSVPFRGDGAWARMNAHLTEPVPKVGQLRPGLPPAVQAVLDRAMAKAPGDRFDTCGAMATALASALRGVTSAAPVRAPESALPGPRPPDASETPPPLTPPPPTAPLATSREAQPPAFPAAPASEPAARSVVWWRQIDRGAGACLGAGVGLALLSAFPPSSPVSVSQYPGELATGQFAAGQLPGALLVLVAGGLHMTRFGHRFRPLLCGVAAGAGLFAFVDSMRVFSFTGANPGGAYASALAHENAALPRAVVALLVALVALTGVLRYPPRPKPRPGPHVLMAMLLAASAIVVAGVAVAIGPKIQVSRLHQLVYGVPLASAVTAAVLLAFAALTRRVPLLAVSATVSGCALFALLAGPLHYPLAIFADLCLLGSAAVLVVGSRRPPADVGPPPPPAARLPWPPSYQPPLWARPKG